MNQWLELGMVADDSIRFVVMVTEYKQQLVIIRNAKRGGWEIPGGNREPGESLLQAASRELYEETGAIDFHLEPFGIYQWNGSFGMVWYAEVLQMEALPNYEIEEVALVDAYPEGMNFGGMFTLFCEKWKEYGAKRSRRTRCTRQPM